MLFLKLFRDYPRKLTRRSFCLRRTTVVTKGVVVRTESDIMHHIVLRLPEKIIARPSRRFEDDLRTACAYSSIQDTTAAVAARSEIVANCKTIANTSVLRPFLWSESSFKFWSKELKKTRRTGQCRRIEWSCRCRHIRRPQVSDCR